ncbi:MAG: GNAT family N-acetyltransferase [Thermoleophilia bacterium]|nr:GNAT family N-acetyltransferase [Thermoleophilia bacterium]
MTAPAAVRRATASDARAIEEVRFAGWAHAYAGLMPAAVFDDWDVGAWALRRAEAGVAPGAAVFVAEDDGGAVVGYAAAGPCRDGGCGDWGEVWAIYVLPRVIGAGVGRALMNACLGHLDGYPRVVVWTLRDNPIAHPFYARAGFARDGASRRQVLGGAELPEVRLTLRWAPSGGGGGGEYQRVR